MRNPVAEARDPIRVVADDPGLPRFARREANRLLAMAASEPELVSARIDEDIPLAALGGLQWRP